VAAPAGRGWHRLRLRYRRLNQSRAPTLGNGRWPAESHWNDCRRMTEFRRRFADLLLPVRAHPKRRSPTGQRGNPSRRSSASPAWTWASRRPGYPRSRMRAGLAVCLAKARAGPSRAPGQADLQPEVYLDLTGAVQILKHKRRAVHLARGELKRKLSACCEVRLNIASRNADVLDGMDALTDLTPGDTRLRAWSRDNRVDVRVLFGA
jgi:hypothetical protein